MAFWKRRPARPRVNVYDSSTQQIHSIPADELAPGMIRVRMEGVEGDVWMDIASLKPGEYRHPPLDEQGKALVREIKDAVDEVYFMTEEACEDGFRRDTHVERELEIWLRIAHVYGELTARTGYSLEKKRKIFEILLSCANNPREQVLSVVDFQPLDRGTADQVVSAFYSR